MSSITAKSEGSTQGPKRQPTTTDLAQKRLDALLKQLPNRSPLHPQLSPSFTSSEIEQHSLLHNPTILQQIAQSDWIQMLDSKLLAHVTSDFLIQGSNLQCNYLETTSSFLSKIIPFIQEQKSLFSSSALQTTQTALSQLQITGNAADIAKQVLALKPGQSFFMQGGWDDTPKATGHSMVYEFYRRDDGNYDIKIYNTGEGASDYHAIASDGKKEKIQRVIQFKGVIPEELGLSSAPNKEHHVDFFQHILRALHNKRYENKEINPQEIYAKTFGHLAPKLADVESGPLSFAASQRSGTCTEYVLKPVAFQHLCKKDLKTYKRYHFYKRFYANLGFFQKELPYLLKNDSRGNNLRYVLSNTSAKLLRATAKLVTNGHLSHEEALQAQTTLCEINEKIQGMQDEIDRNAPLRVQNLAMTPHDVKKVSQNLLALPIVTTKTEVPDLQTLAPTTPLHVTGSTFPSVLESLLSTATKMKEKDPFAALTEIDQHFETFPSPLTGLTSLCKQIPPTELAKSIEALSQLIHLYSHLCLSHTRFFPAQQNTALAMLAYQHRLCVEHDKNVFGMRARLHEFSVDLRCYYKSLYRS